MAQKSKTKVCRYCAIKLVIFVVLEYKEIAH